jgi:Carboxypeptidase regulatory-like domain/TonB dependent receptor
MSATSRVGRESSRVVISIVGTAIAALLLLVAAGSAHAQVLYGSITGTVTDSSGAVIPNVKINITNQQTGEVRTTAANQTGTYVLLDVLPGTYTVVVPQTGNFAAYKAQGIQLEVNRQVRIDIMLQAGSVTTEVTVSGAPPALQTETAEVDSEISQTQLNALPITSSAGRNYQALYTIIPGASAVQEKNSTSANPSRSMSVNINGNSYNGNTTRIDGAVNYYGWLPYLIAYVPPADDIENVSFTTNAFTAEQGQAGGAAIKVTTKSGGSQFHGSGWEYYQDAAINAKPYTYTATGPVPKFVFHQFGFNIGGPVYIPHILTGKKKLFFFENFERTTQRKLISGNFTVPTTAMLGGDFTLASPYATLYDPQPGGVAQTGAGTANGYLLPSARTTTFMSEYGCNCIPAARQSSAAATMLALLQPVASKLATPSAASLSQGMANDYLATGTYAYNRNTSDSKIDYMPSEATHIFGKYSIEPFTINDPQGLGAAGGSTMDGGQPGATAGRIQNIGLGVSHVIRASLVLDADFGYTRQVSGAQSTVDLSDGDFGVNTLKIPGTNGAGNDYAGQPIFSLNNTFSTLGNAQTANPFKFRDNQFTGDINLSWVKGTHSTKYGFTYYHFDLNHFQPNLGSGVSNPRGGFQFDGQMTCNGSCGVTAYNALADFLLGLPNNGTGASVSKAEQSLDPNSLRWSEFGAYAQDQWAITPKLTLTYGIRYEYYPPPYKDHTGPYIVHTSLPQTGNVEIGGVNGNPESAGLQVGHGNVVPRIGITYRLDEKTVVRTGFGMTTDPDSYRVIRDAYPGSITVSYSGSGTGTVAVDPANSNAPMTLTYGIPKIVYPSFSSGFVSLPVAASTQTVPLDYNRGYIMSWNLFVERQLPSQWVANVGYVGTEYVRQPATVSPYNAAPFPSASTPCMANGQYNPSTGLKGNCSFQDNTIINQQWCAGTPNLACYNTGGISLNEPIFRSFYNALQSQLTRNTSRDSSIGVVYTFSRAIDFEDNGAGSGSAGTTFNYPAYLQFNRGLAGYDIKHNLQVFTVYNLPFGYGQPYANHGLAALIIGGFQLNGQFSHTSGTPFSVNANTNAIGNVAPGWGATYAQLAKPYHQLSGHNRGAAGGAALSGGKPWFDPSTFTNPVEPTATAAGNPANASPNLPNTSRNAFRGPGASDFNASVFRAFHLYHESEFQVRFEAFNVFNHALLYGVNSGVPNNTVTSNANIAAGNYGTLGTVTSFGQPYSPTQGARTLQFSGRINF